ncbi:MAG: hypothetical protein WA418_05460 [Bradyrhizobium sp.]
MPREAAERQRNRRPAAPISTKQPARDQLPPPLLVEGLEAVRDPNC